MSDTGDLDPQLIQQIDTFKNLFEGIANVKSFDEMIMSITENYETSNQLSQQSNFIGTVNNVVYGAKKNFLKDLRGLHNTLYKSFSFLLRSEDEEQKSFFLQALYGWLRTFKITDNGDKGDDSQIKDYFGELNVVKSSLRDVKTLADEMADTNKLLNGENSNLKQQLKNAEENLERKNNRCDKLANTIDLYKTDTVKLIHQVELELEKLKMLNSDEQSFRIDKLKDKVRRASQEFANDDFRGSLMSPMKSPERKLNLINQSANSTDRDNIWFDIKKSQERYENLLDSYQNVLKDKDAYIRTLEDEIAESKKARFNLENEHFDRIREKDREINDMKSEMDGFENQITRLNAEIKNLKDEMIGLHARNQKKVVEVVNEKGLWDTEKQMLTDQIENLQKEFKK